MIDRRRPNRSWMEPKRYYPMYAGIAGILQKFLSRCRVRRGRFLRLDLGVQLATQAPEAARQLLGCFLRTADCVVRITEVEAYNGTDDPASHAYRGPNKRNAVMFGPAGHLYTYTMHGHTCCNVVCSPAGVANAVLIRAGEVVDGVDAARTRRRPGVVDWQLARGPGNLTRALGITMEHGGVNLCEAGAPVRLEPGALGEREEVAVGPRVGVSRAADEPLRFWIDGDPTVSAYRRSPRAEL